MTRPSQANSHFFANPFKTKKNKIELNRLVKNGETKQDQLKPVSWIVDMKLSLQAKSCGWQFSKKNCL